MYLRLEQTAKLDVFREHFVSLWCGNKWVSTHEYLHGYSQENNPYSDSQGSSMVSDPDL